MNEKIARSILPIGDGDTIGPNYGHYMSWSPEDVEICLDSNFTVEELEAIVWWMRNKSSPVSVPNDSNTVSH